MANNYMNATKTHCLNGHPFDNSNTYHHNGKRHCIQCRKDRKAKNWRSWNYRGAPNIPATNCELCGKSTGRKISVDHDHKTNTFRGWLCKGCNAKVGWAESIGIPQLWDYIYRNRGVQIDKELNTLVDEESRMLTAQNFLDALIV